MNSRQKNNKSCRSRTLTPRGQQEEADRDAALRIETQTELKERDRFRWLRRQSYEAIAEARKRVENVVGFYTEAEIKTAKEFLSDLGKEARNTGRSRGDTPKAAENERMLRVFFCLSQGQALKEIAIEEKGSKDYERKIRTLSVLIKRFSQRVHAAFCSHCGSVPASILHDGAHENCWGYLSSYFGSIELWPGVKSNCREHGYALCEALRYYALGKAKQTPHSPRTAPRTPVNTIPPESS